MKVNGEAIYGTRPWKIFGEGPGAQKTTSGAGMNGTAEHFNEKSRKNLTGADVRFTTKDSVLYAFVMGQNTGETRFAALQPARALEKRKVSNVRLLGSPESLNWRLADDGLSIASPRTWPTQYAAVFKISFS